MTGCERKDVCKSVCKSVCVCVPWRTKRGIIKNSIVQFHFIFISLIQYTGPHATNK